MKKQLLFVTWSLTQGGGEAQSVVNILNNLNLEKYDIDVFELNRGCKQVNLKQSINLIKPIVNYQYNKDLRKQKIKLNNCIRHPEEIVNLFNKTYDCVIACNRGITSFLAAFIPSLSKIVWIRGSVENLNSKNYKEIVVQEIINKQKEKQNQSFKNYDKIVVVSDSLEESFKNLFIEHQNKVVKIYNSIDPDEVIKKADEKIECYNPTHNNVLINIGRLREIKNQKLLIDSVEILSKDLSDIELIIIGEGSLRERLDSYIKEKNLSNIVKLVGFYSNPFPLLKKGNIFCLSSISEGFCLSISEANVLNIPFISTNVGGAKELLDTACCGYIVDSNPQAFADKIKEILTNQELYKQLQENCKIATTRFSVKQLALQVEQLIDETLCLKRGGYNV